MRVCHFISSAPEGHYFKSIVPGLLEKGCDVLIAQLSPGQRPLWLEKYPEVLFTSLGSKGNGTLPLACFRLARFLKANAVEIVHTHLFDAGLVASLAKYLYGRPKYVYMRHHTSVVRILGSSFHVRLDRWMAERADHLVTVSHNAKDYMQSVDRISSPIDVVYLGFDFERYAPDRDSRDAVRNEFGFGDNDLVIGYVGNFAPGKGHEQLILAYEEILKTHPEARLFLIGTGRVQEVDGIVGRLGLGRRIVFAGWRDDIAACLNAMDIFVQPSLSEAFSQVLIEAMGVGLPVVATDVGGAREVIEDQIHGLIVPPGDVAALVSAVEHLAVNTEQRNEMAMTGQRSVRERFTVERMVDEQYELYCQWLAMKT